MVIFKFGKISCESYNTFQPVGSKPGILYRLAKIHKLATDNIPSFHPILSAIGTHSNKLAKFFVPLVEQLTNEQFSIWYRFFFSTKLQNLDSSLIIANLDAVLLFTNILLQGTIDLDVKNLFNNEKYFLDISKDSFCELLTFTMNETTVIFNNE